MITTKLHFERTLGTGTGVINSHPPSVSPKSRCMKKWSHFQTQETRNLCPRVNPLSEEPGVAGGGAGGTPVCLRLMLH